MNNRHGAFRWVRMNGRHREDGAEPAASRPHWSRFLFLCFASSLAIILIAEHILMIPNFMAITGGGEALFSVDFNVRRWVHAVSALLTIGVFFWLGHLYSPTMSRWHLVPMR